MYEAFAFLFLARAFLFVKMAFGKITGIFGEIPIKSKNRARGKSVVLAESV
ncbi:MAG: hypothetical protein Q8929_19330 [Bacillota bacterium]|nr:hypothetical protein [Bacillota bacterium]